MMEQEPMLGDKSLDSEYCTSQGFCFAKAFGAPPASLLKGFMLTFCPLTLAFLHALRKFKINMLF